MKRKTQCDRRICALLNEAEEESRCAWAQTPEDTQAFSRRKADGSLVRPHRGLYVRSSVWSKLKPDERARWIIRALAKLHPDWTFCLYSAALMHGLPVSYRLLTCTHICIDPSCSTKSSADIIRHADTRTDRVAVIDGVRVTSFASTVIDCLRVTPFEDGMAIADAALRTWGVEHELLEGMVYKLAYGRRGYLNALRIARLADARAESGGESIARAIMITAGISPHDLQPTFSDPYDKGRTLRPDFLFKLKDGTTVLGELDGKEKYTNERMLIGKTTADALIEERKREAHLSALGMPIVRFSMDDVWKPGKLAQLFAVVDVTPEALVPGDYRDTAIKPLDYRSALPSLNAGLDPKPGY